MTTLYNPQDIRSTILRQISLTPTKIMTERACHKLMAAIDNGCNLGDDIIQAIVSKIIEAGRMTDEAVPYFVYKNRTSLLLANSKVSGKYLLQSIRTCNHSLTKLDVGGCFQVDDSKISDILDMCSQLTSLNVRNCRKLTDRFLQVLAKRKHLPITYLNIGGDYNITNQGVKHFIENYTHIDKIEELVLSGLPLEDDTINLIVERCKGLRSLGLGYLDVQESTWTHVLKTLGPQLEKLDISWPSTTPLSRNTPPNPQGMAEILAMECPKLVEIDLTGHRSFTLEDVVELLELRGGQVQLNPEQVKAVELLKVKFIATPKAVMEQQLGLVIGVSIVY